MTGSVDFGIEVYESMFTLPDLDKPLPPDDLDDLDFEGLGIAVAPPVPRKPFDPLDELGVQRDRYGRPMILPDPAWRLSEATWPDRKKIKGQHADGRRPFTRVSTACGWNCLQHGLSVWRIRHALLALARRPDVQVRLQALTYADGSRIDELMDELLTRAADDGSDPGGELVAAALGTAFHDLTVPGAPRVDPVFGPTTAQLAITAKALEQAYERVGLEPIAHEQFGVDYSRNLGGRLDHLVRVVHTRKIKLDVGTVCVLDKKSGKDLHEIDYATQCAMYARTRPHDWKTGRTGETWHSDLDPDHGFIAAASLVQGIVKIYQMNTPTYLVDSAVDRYRNSLQRTSTHCSGPACKKGEDREMSMPGRAALLFGTLSGS